MKKAIGVFDSGLGGLTVVRELRRVLPHEDIVYLGDTARVPYGTKSPRTVERYALNCQNFLLGHSPKLIMVACNTASANAMDAMTVHSPVPVIGAVRPGAQTALAATKTKSIAVLGTLATITSGAYESAIQQFSADTQIISLACPMFVPLVEEGWANTEIAEAIVTRYLEPLFSRHNQIDTLVLGCTHYPVLRDTISKVCMNCCDHNIAIVDSAAAMAKQAVATLVSEPAVSRKGRLHAVVTDVSRMKELAPLFLGEELESLELVDL